MSPFMELQSPSQNTPMKKRKREHSPNRASSDLASVTFSAESIDERPKDSPYLLTFPGVQPPLDTTYQVYKNSSSTIRKMKQRIVSASSSNPIVQFTGSNFGNNSTPNLHSRYLIGLYSKSSSELTFQEAPIINMTRTVRSLKEAEATIVDKSKIIASRNSLGESFGTKKVKQKIRAIEKNKIDSNALEAASGEIQSTIDVGATNKPSKDELEIEMAEDSIIPPHDTETTDVASIYSYNDIISKEEYSALNVKVILKVKNSTELKELLGQRTSEYVLAHLNAILATTSRDKNRTKTLLYVHYLYQLYKLPPRSLKDPGMISRAIASHGIEVPNVIANTWCQRFAVKTEAGAGNIKYVWTNKSKEKVLLYMLVLCLMLDNYSLELSMLTKDLGLSMSKLTLYLRTLGCSIDAITKAEKEAMGLSDYDSKSYKKAVLKAPFKEFKVGIGKKK